MKQLIVFVAFGEKYLNEFNVCKQTIPPQWEYLLITDQEWQGRRVTAPESLADRIAFRINIHDHINLNDWDQVWYIDSDFIFKGDLLGKYAASQQILVSAEPNTPLSNYHICQDLTPMEIARGGPAINAGLYAVPRAQFAFFEAYRKRTLDFIERKHGYIPEQQVLNSMYHRREFDFGLIEPGDIGFPPQGTYGRLADHYLGIYDNKVDMMLEGIAKLQS